MRQRLSLARTLIHRPSVLFLDEPTSGLDPESTKKVNELLLELSREEGTTIFLCTHQLRYAQEICHEYGLMDKGQLLALGSLPELRKRTFNSYKVTIETDFMPPSLKSERIKDNIYELVIQEKAEIPQLVEKLSTGRQYRASNTKGFVRGNLFCFIGRGRDACLIIGKKRLWSRM
ncbi:AAA family ATPase [Enterococcus avium]